MLCHPIVIGELACGNLRNRAEILSRLAALPTLSLSSHQRGAASLGGPKACGEGARSDKRPPTGIRAFVEVHTMDEGQGPWSRRGRSQDWRLNKDELTRRFRRIGLRPAADRGRLHYPRCFCGGVPDTDVAASGGAICPPLLLP